MTPKQIIEQIQRDAWHERKLVAHEMRDCIKAALDASTLASRTKWLNGDRIVTESRKRGQFEATLDRLYARSTARVVSHEALSWIQMVEAYNVHWYAGHFFYRYLRLFCGFDLVSHSFVRRSPWINEDKPATKEQNLRGVYANQLAQSCAIKVELLRFALDSVARKERSATDVSLEILDQFATIDKQSSVYFEAAMQNAIAGDAAKLEVLSSYVYDALARKAGTTLRNCLKREHGSFTSGLLEEIPAIVALMKDEPVALLPGKVRYSLEKQHTTIGEKHLSNEKRRYAGKGRYQASLIDFQEVDAVTPDDFTRDFQNREILDKILQDARLTLAEQTIYRLMFSEGRTETEVSRRLGKKVGAVRSCKNRVRAKLQASARHLDTQK